MQVPAPEPATTTGPRGLSLAAAAAAGALVLTASTPALGAPAHTADPHEQATPTDAAAVTPPEVFTAPHPGLPAEIPAEAALSDLVTAEAIGWHMENLSTIAEYNGGNRATNTPGYDVSALYVEDQLQRAGYETWRDEYDYELWREQSDPVLGVTAPDEVELVEDEDFNTMSYSGSGEVSAPAVAVADGDPAGGCAAEDFADFPEGAVAITVRGECAFGDKVRNAADAGASAALVVNDEDESFLGTVEEPVDIPALGVSGLAGADLLAAGDGLELEVAVDAEISEESSYSVLAETAGGADDNVVMVGGHLDSVEDGPGINDNASGTGFVLETAIQMAQQEQPENKVRFAFWGTEEEGLTGSNEYVAGLSEEELDAVALYLNFDMIGSHNYARFVLDGRMELEDSQDAPPGSGAIAEILEEGFDAQDQVHEPGVLSGRSDYFAFMEEGVPSGGLFSGGDGTKTEEQAEWYGGTAGEPFDPYYHTADDTLENVNWDSVADLSGAAAHGVETLAESTLPVNGVTPMADREPVELPRKGDAWLR
ncbi:M20/M25/M40 family metallo-hydrolase [Nocardiopsis sp. HNM0947]|uniref:M20/M25/M40 family metallo-hydrolase n=1 Tax=Nocardiopsis coralli TaxID=2772213 RepID=A0ABR9PCD5_9ACTN|nr:M20/M25/M40 family metallo-hydrolase [Nocardiopsis coralli]MBE3001491.1 M20/M25/M40 family metallo-hydrolase [Nocardiopsis coralli]